MEYIIQKQWKPIVSVVKKMLLTKIQVLEKKNYQIVLFVAKKLYKHKELHKFD